MGAQLTRSVWDLRSIIAGYLEATLPGLIDQARTDWSLSAEQLPYPAAYNANDPDKVNGDKYPFIGVEFPSDDNFLRTDYTDRMEEEYMMRYATSISIWVRTPRATPPDTEWEKPEYDTAVRLRDDLLELVSQALLLNQMLGSDRCYIEEESLRRNRLAPMRLTSQGVRYVAGALISVNVRYRTELSRGKLGDANTFVVTEVKVGAEEPMP